MKRLAWVVTLTEMQGLSEADFDGLCTHIVDVCPYLDKVVLPRSCITQRLRQGAGRKIERRPFSADHVAAMEYVSRFMGVRTGIQLEMESVQLFHSIHLKKIECSNMPCNHRK